MTHDREAITEIAKATQEVAKTAGKGIEVAGEMGTFISQFVKGPLTQISGIFEDKLRYMRWARQQRLIQQSLLYMAELRLEAPNKEIPLKNAIPFLEHATLEENDNIQDMWVRLLVNGTNSTIDVSIERSFIEILAQISPLEAQILNAIYALPFNVSRNAGIVTQGLPQNATIAEEKPAEEYAEPSESVKLALANLVRLGCLNFVPTWGGGESFTEIVPTLIGHELISACAIKTVNPNL